MKLISALKNLSFSSQLAIFSIGFTIIITGTISWVVIWESQDALKAATFKQLQSNAQIQIQKIEEGMANFEANADFFASSGLVNRFFNSHGSSTPPSSSEQELLKTYANRFIQNYNLAKVSFFKNGENVFFAGPSGLTLNPPSKTIDAISYFYDQPYVENENYYINIYKKLELEGFEGIVGFKFNLQETYNSVLNNALSGDKGETLLGISSGDSVVFINPLRFEKKTAFKKKVSIYGDQSQHLIHAVQKLEGSGESIDYRGQPVLAYWAYIDKLNWGLVTKIDKSEVYATTQALKIKVLLISAVLIILSIVLTILISRGMVRPIIELKGIIEQLSQGNQVVYNMKDVANNEVGQMIKASLDLANFQNNVILFTSHIAVKEFDKNKDIDINKGEIGNALLSMEQNLIRVEKEDQIKRWSNEGIAKFSTIIRDFSRDTRELSSMLISELVQYIDCHQGGLFALSNDETKLEQLAFYAYDRQKFAEQSLEKGDGLLWQVMSEKEKIYMTVVPIGYPYISSGLGEGAASSILLVPLIINEEIYGVIELLSFRKIDPYKIEFIENIAENIAGAISALKINERTQELLKMSQTKTQELTTQEEELRQNMEEMQATQEEMERIQSEIETKDAMLTSIINYSDDTYFCLDVDYNILVANNTLRERYRKDGIEIVVGDNVFNYLPKEQHEIWRDRYRRILAGDSFSEDMEREVAGDTIYIKAYYDPVTNDQGKIIGATVRSKDVTDLVKLKMRLKVLENKNRE